MLNGLLANDLKDYCALARSCVEINDDNLLLCPKKKLATGERNRQGWLKKRCSNVAGAVVVSPRIVVVVCRTLGNDFLKELTKILMEGSLSPIRKMQRYLSHGEAGEVRHEPLFPGSRRLTSPRRADGVKVALHFLIGAAAPP